MLLSATLIKIGTILISIAVQFRKIGDPTDAKLMKLSLLSKLKQDKNTSAKDKQKSMIDNMQRFLDVIYGKVFSTRAFGRVLLGSLSISFLFYLWLGVYLFGEFSGLITIFSWPKIVMYFAWTSIIVSLVSLIDITIARAVLQRLNFPNIRLPTKLMLVGILFAIAGFSFILATALVSATAINSWNLLKGDLSGYWSLEFILNRFYILSKNPLEAVSKIEIVGVQNSVSTQALTWFAGLGSLSVLVFASVISVYEKLLTGIADWRFFKLAIIRRFKILRLLWIYPAFAAAFLIVSGFVFAKLGL